jgi:hypothetical protein
MYSFKHHHEVYFCGSSILYMLLHDYDKSNVNDIDIWLNSSHHENHTTHFMKRFTKKVSPTSTHLSIIEKEGILDVQPNQAKIGLQYIHVQNKSAMDVINHFDLPCVSAYFHFDYQKEEQKMLCLTTHFIESILQKKIFDFYNWKSVFHCDLYRVQTRILKYQSRGFELSPTLLSKIEHVQRPRDIQHETIIKCRGEIPHYILNKFRRKYFPFDFEYYYDGRKQISDWDSFVFLNNHSIFQTHFQPKLPKERTRFGDEVYDSHTLQYIDKLSSYSNFMDVFKMFCFVNITSGLPIDFTYNTNEYFPIDNFIQKYDIHHIDICDNIIFIDTKSSSSNSTQKKPIFDNDAW